MAIIKLDLQQFNNSMDGIEFVCGIFNNDTITTITTTVFAKIKKPDVSMNSIFTAKSMLNSWEKHFSDFFFT